MINGNSTKLFLGKENAYATKGTMQTQIQFSSCDLKDTINKTEDGLLTGGKSKSRVETMSVATEGSFSTVAKPETIGFILKGVLGVEDEVTESTVTGKFIHTFKAIGNSEDDYLPSFTAIFDRGVATTAYKGMVFNSVSFSASPEDYLKVDCELLGHSSETCETPEDVTFEKNRSLKFHQAKIFIEEEEFEVTNISFSYANNASSLKTTKTGLHSTRPQQGQREITANLDVIYNSDSQAIRSQYWLTDDTFKIEMEFEDENGNKLSIEIPCCQITTFDEPAISGAETLTQSIALSAVDSDNDLIVVKLINDVEERY